MMFTMFECSVASSFRFLMSMLAAGTGEFLANPPVVIKNYQPTPEMYKTNPRGHWHHRKVRMKPLKFCISAEPLSPPPQKKRLAKHPKSVLNSWQIIVIFQFLVNFCLFFWRGVTQTFFLLGLVDKQRAASSCGDYSRAEDHQQRRYHHSLDLRPLGPNI